MDDLVANYHRMNDLADQLARWIPTLELGDLNHLRRTLDPSVTGSSEVSDACREFEDEWSFGRDRISTSIRKLYEFLWFAAKEYENADTQLAIAAFAADSCSIPSKNHADWWRSLTPEQQEVIIRERPSAIGNLDGLPPDVRYRANAIAIREHIAYLETTNASPEEIKRFRSYLGPDLLLDQKITDLRKSGADPETIARFEQLRDAQLSRNPPRQILVFDPSGEGRIAEVHGSLTTADNVVVFVPGIGNDIVDYAESFNSQAQNLYGAGRGDTAVIAWLGYDTPSGPKELDVLNDPSALLSDRAEAEAGKLVSFTEGLDSTVGGRVTVVAHSYGTVVATAAAQQGMHVDRVVLVGDPGVQVSNVSAYNGAEVFAMRHPLDPVSNSNHHGYDPTSPEFGATVLDTNDSAYRNEVLKTAANPLLGPTGAVIAAADVVIGLDGHVSFFETQSNSATVIMNAVEGNPDVGDGYIRTHLVHEDGSSQIVDVPDSI